MRPKGGTEGMVGAIVPSTTRSGIGFATRTALAI